MKKDRSKTISLAEKNIFNTFDLGLFWLIIFSVFILAIGISYL